jgi:hypothetical protein
VDPADQLVRRSYLHSGGIWTSDPDGALLRLDAEVEHVLRVEAQNILFEPDPDGGWQPIDEHDRPAVERGLVWQVWQTAVRGKPFRGFEGVCAIDARLAAELLAELQPRDEDGHLIRSDACGLVFLLDDIDAKAFVERVAAVGGLVQRRRVLAPAQVQESVQRLQALLARLEVERELDLRCLREAREGLFVTAGAFEQRSELYRAGCVQSSELLRLIRRELRAQLAQGRGRDERAQARALLEESEALAEQVRLLYEQRDGEASELALLEARAQGRGPSAQTHLARAAAFRELARAARESGILVSDRDGQVRLRLGEGELELCEDGLLRYLSDND